jgi:hypothetical protein
MTEDFVSFSIAKKLKKLGYTLDTAFHYDDNGGIIVSLVEFDERCVYPCPEIHQVLKWLRDGEKMYIEPCILSDADTDADGKVINEYIYWSFSVANIETGDMVYYEYEHVDDKRFDSYEQAAIEGIEYCLDNWI